MARSYTSVTDYSVKTIRGKMEKFLYRQIPYSLHGLNSPDLFYAEDKHKVNMDYVDTRIP